MRIILLISIFLFGLSFTAKAQSSGPKETSPKSERPPEKTDEKSQKADSQDEANDTIDIDAFFKRGEENAQKGMGCEIPPEPVA
ncbi:hypothetical protein [Hellea balneolensis]|uniref:hypothetical protein n=1 Tax=Hellea balneolensis TaxID=287478 RepID=UPI000405FA84|nr:hypothetical protein [Hellea balneolensis]